MASVFYQCGVTLGKLFNVLLGRLQSALALENVLDTVGEELPLNLGKFQPPEVEDDLVARAAGAAVGLQQAVIGVGFATDAVALGDSFDEHASKGSTDQERCQALYQSVGPYTQESTPSPESHHGCISNYKNALSINTPKSPVG